MWDARTGKTYYLADSMPSDGTPLVGKNDELQRHLLQHAERMWRAEEANATRLASKATMVSAGITATLGFKLFVTGNAIPTLLKAGFGERLGIICTGGVSAAFLLMSFRDVVDIKIRPSRILPWIKSWIPLTHHAVPVDVSGRASSACETLNPTEEERDLVQGMAESELLRYLTQKVDVAVSELRQRNSTRKWRVESAERRFLFAVLFLLFAAAWYVSVVVRVEKEHSNDTLKLQQADQQGSAGLRGGRSDQ